MAGSQQQQIIDTIFSMKRRLLRKDDSSDDDEPDTLHNRQQSLKRKAQYSRSGDADFLADPRPYKKRIEHAGYHRYILQRNPPRFDPDGDLVDLDDEYEDEDDLSTVEENPYADILLENLLAPLTSAADLPNHPSMSVAYTSTHLSDLTAEAGAMSRKERITLAQAKRLFTKMQGDSTFAPSALATMPAAPIQEPSMGGTNGATANGTSQHHRRPEQNGDLQENASTPQDIVMEDVGQPNGTPRQNGEANGNAAEKQNGEHITNGTSHGAETDGLQENGERDQSPGDDASDAESQQTAHRMTTRARAQAASTPSPPDSPSSAINPIHPLFLFPTDSLPDRDFGLPLNEAEETRMLLMAYVQKQEEISRISNDLYMGMMQADRMRQEVFKWSKAEAHVGEMSDGEDWYDREEWDLEQDLIKGRDEEEDDTAVAGKKSTRQRRTKPDKEDRTIPESSPSAGTTVTLVSLRSAAAGKR